MYFPEEQMQTQTHRDGLTCDGFKCEFPNCTKTFTTKNGRVSHLNREHHGKKYKCNICSKRLASNHSVQRHISSAHADDGVEEEKEEYITTIVYDRVEEIVPAQREDEVIQQQREKIQQLNNDWKNAQEEIKHLRQQLKSMI